MALSWWSMIYMLSLILCIAGVGSVDEEFEGMSTLTLEHSFDDGLDPVFTKRGTITIRSLKSGVAHFTQENPLSENDLGRLKALSASDGVYRIRVPQRSTVNSADPVTYISSFTKACALYESRLADLLTVNVDQSGSILGISITTSIPYCTGGTTTVGEDGEEELDEEYDDINNFNTNVEVVQTVAGPQPETQMYIQKMEQEKAEKAKGQQGDNRSFFAKYWMYLVPLFIFLMVVSSADPGGQGGR